MAGSFKSFDSQKKILGTKIILTESKIIDEYVLATEKPPLVSKANNMSHVSNFSLLPVTFPVNLVSQVSGKTVV